MDSLDKMFIFCALVSIVLSLGFGLLIALQSGWPLAILAMVIMAPLLLISGLTTSETLARPFGKKNRQGELKVHGAIHAIMAIIYYVVLAILLFFVFKFARLI